MTDRVVPKDDDVQRLAAQLVEGRSPEEIRQLLGALLARPADDVLAQSPRSPEPTVHPVPECVSGFRVRVDLVGAKPPVWRRLELPGDMTLPHVHDALQAAMGWTNSHLHRFLTGNGPRAPYFVTSFDVEEGEDGVLEDAVRLDQVLVEAGDRLWYEYDFGDGWGHTIVVEAVHDEPPSQATCVDGRNACPPEDCGGIGGYAELAAWVRAGSEQDSVPSPFADSEQAWDWLPLAWHPDEFSVADANAALSAALAEPVAVPAELAELLSRVPSRGAGSLHELLTRPVWQMTNDIDDSEAAEITESYRLLLGQIGDGVKLTGAGYLPPAVVEPLAARVGITNWWIGKANREDLTPPISTLRTTAQALGLVSVRKGVLRPTQAARRAGTDSRVIWEQIVSRLPIGRTEFDREAGWVALAIVGSGAPAEAWDDLGRGVLADLGWRLQVGDHRRAPSPVCPTYDVLTVLAGSLRTSPVPRGGHPAVAATARAVALRAGQ